ncbi:unnamed protein product, partial [Sphenostylis stenocarpa]
FGKRQPKRMTKPNRKGQRCGVGTMLRDERKVGQRQTSCECHLIHPPPLQNTRHITNYAKPWSTPYNNFTAYNCIIKFLGEQISSGEPCKTLGFCCPSIPELVRDAVFSLSCPSVSSFQCLLQLSPSIDTAQMLPNLSPSQSLTYDN